jgi:hypothetical protein
VRNLRIKWLAVVTVLLSHIIFIPDASANNCSVTYGTVTGTTRSAQITTGSGCAWSVPTGVTSLTYLIVGGGGGGGGARLSTSSPNLGGGGGGGGGQVVASSLSVVAGNSISVTVGTGGAGGAASSDGGNGTTSTITYLGSTTTAGAGLAGKGSNGNHEQANLSGDGGANNLYSGGLNDWDGGGGGAGASSAGSNGIDIGGQGGTGGAGGTGVSNSIRGTAQFFGGGGGGGGTPSGNSSETDGFGGAGGSSVGGSGGGGAGIMPTAGAANTGSGGGGGGWRDSNTGAQRAGAAGANGIVIFSYSKTAASVSSVSITSSAGADRTYSLATSINVTVAFSEAVTVTGTPLIPIVGLSSRNLSYSSGSGTSSLVFAYTVQSSDLNLTGISITANSLTLNSGSIMDTGGLGVTITHLAIAASSNHLVDGVVPTISTAAGINVAENATSVATLAASETVIWEILGGTDLAFFTLETATGVLTISARDFESPQDGGNNNVYEVSIRATDLGGNVSLSRTFSITITNVAEVANIGVPSLAATAAKGTSVNITITVDVAGKVRFLVNGKRIANCQAVSTTGSAPSLTATCAWKPSTTGRTAINAILNPTSGQYLAVTSSALNTFVVRRTNSRS